MSTMQAAAIITAVDRASPVFRQVAAAAQAAAQRYQGVAGRIDAATGAIRSSATAMALPAVAAFTGLIQRTQDFEKALYGVQVAGIADNLSMKTMTDGSKTAVVDFEKIRESAKQTSEEAMRLSKSLAQSPTGLLRAGEAAGKMGLSADKMSTLMEMAGSVHLQDRQMAPEKAAEFLGSVGKQFGFEKEGRDYNAEITKATNYWLGVANMTRTSAGRMEEGLRQFAALWGSLGVSFKSTAATLGAITQAGQLDVEAGTAFKSLAVRMLNMTHKGRDAAVVSGFAREVRERGLIDVSGVTSKQSLLNLKQVLPGQITKKDEPGLRKFLELGEREKKFTDESWQNMLFDRLYKITGAKDEPSRKAVQEKALTAILTGGGKMQMDKILLLLAEMHKAGNLTDAHLANIAEGRHINKYKAFFEMVDEYLKIMQKLDGVTDQYTKSGNKLWVESAAGRWDGAIAAVDRALVKLRSTMGVQSLTGAFERVADAVSNMPRGVQEFGGTALAASIGISALGFALSGVAKAGALIAASPILRALLIGGGAAYMAAPEIFRGFGPEGEFGKWEMFGEGAPIWTTLEKMKAAGAEVGSLFGEISTSAGNAAREVAQMLGIDASGSLLSKGLQGINAMFDGIAEKARIARTEMIPAVKDGRFGDVPIAGMKIDTWMESLDFMRDRLLNGDVLPALAPILPVAPEKPPQGSWMQRKFGDAPDPDELAPGQEPPRLRLLQQPEAPAGPARADDSPPPQRHQPSTPPAQPKRAPPVNKFADWLDGIWSSARDVFTRSSPPAAPQLQQPETPPGSRPDTGWLDEALRAAKGATALPPQPAETPAASRPDTGWLDEALRAAKGATVLPPQPAETPIASRPDTGWLDEVWRTAKSATATPAHPVAPADGAAPLGMLRDLQLPPQRVDVQGQADVKWQGEVVVRVEGPGTVVDHRGGSGQTQVPLNTGKTMPDTGVR